MCGRTMWNGSFYCNFALILCRHCKLICEPQNKGGLMHENSFGSVLSDLMTLCHKLPFFNSLPSKVQTFWLSLSSPTPPSKDFLAFSKEEKKNCHSWMPFKTLVRIILQCVFLCVRFATIVSCGLLEAGIYHHWGGNVPVGTLFKWCFAGCDAFSSHTGLMCFCVQSLWKIDLCWLKLEMWARDEIHSSHNNFTQFYLFIVRVKKSCCG